MPNVHVTALAEIRDFLPTPDPGSKLEDAWVDAICDPIATPDYVKACIGELHKELEAKEVEIKKLAEAFAAQQKELTKLKDAEEVRSYGRH